jgi:hypothetical protein
MDTENTFNSENTENTKAENVKNTVNANRKKSIYLNLRRGFVLFLCLTLPFHYIPERGMVFFKENLTFSNTVITGEDIDNMIRKYNNAENIWEKQSLEQTPLARKLFEKGVIVQREGKNDYD